ncbi:hypothetical protein V2G26_017790 [Clonostachys chloroleuca]
MELSHKNPQRVALYPVFLGGQPGCCNKTLEGKPTAAGPLESTRYVTERAHATTWRRRFLREDRNTKNPSSRMMSV